MTLRQSLNFEPNELGFGTSGLRGLVTDMTDLECFINVTGFLDFLTNNDELQKSETIYIAGDLRDSTSHIMAVTQTACERYGLKVVNCGLIPTPALAYFAINLKAPCIMVTGSHIPADRNGIKFFKRDGEVLKEDEAAIKEAVQEVRASTYESDTAKSLFNADGSLKNISDLLDENYEPSKQYIKRFIDFFPYEFLKGKIIVVYQHSAVGRDILVEVLRSFGADVIPTERSDTFVPIDTENVTDENKKLFKKLAEENPGLMAIISTDGDSDRPFVIDENGDFYRGDLVGCIVAKYLNAEFMATPISSNDAVDLFAKENNIESIHTRIGSPFVIAAMDKVNRSSKVGWEVNGGFLTGNDIRKDGRALSALPTRDAFLPALCILHSAVLNNKKVSELFDGLPQRFTGGGLIDNVDPIKIEKFKHVCSDRIKAHSLMDGIFSRSSLGVLSNIDLTDGLRLVFESNEVLHLRPSGNAPQFRVYTNAETQVRADELVKEAIKPEGYIELLLKEI